MRLHRRHTRTNQSYSPGGANVQPHIAQPNWHPYHIGSHPCWAILSISTVGHVGACPVPAHFAIKIAPSYVGIWTPSNTWFHEPTQVHTSNGISIGSAVFFGAQGHVRETDQQAGHATLSVAIGRIYLVLRCGLINMKIMSDGQPTCCRRKPLRTSGTVFIGPDALPVTQPTVWRHWRKFKITHSSTTTWMQSRTWYLKILRKFSCKNSLFLCCQLQYSFALLSVIAQ